MKCAYCTHDKRKHQLACLECMDDPMPYKCERYVEPATRAELLRALPVQLTPGDIS